MGDRFASSKYQNPTSSKSKNTKDDFPNLSNLKHISQIAAPWKDDSGISDSLSEDSGILVIPPDYKNTRPGTPTIRGMIKGKPGDGLLTDHDVSKLVKALDVSGRAMLNELQITRDSSNASRTSPRSGNPLKVSVQQLSWGSVRLRKKVQKALKIKNASSKRLVIRLELSGPGFEVHNADEVNLISLHGQETRNIIVNFCPTAAGIAVGYLRFTLGASSDTLDIDIPLYACGGRAEFKLNDVFKGPIGSHFLTMGELKDFPRPLTKTFTIFNSGRLDGFAICTLDSVDMDLPNICDCFELTPNMVIIPAGRIIPIQVTFNVRKDHIKKITKKINGVFTLATLKIVCGDENTRQRIRQVLRLLNENEKTQHVSPSLYKLWGAIPKETDIKDLRRIEESAETAGELVSTLRSFTIALTLNHDDFNETYNATLTFPDADETIMYRTVVAKPSSSTQSDTSVWNYNTSSGSLAPQSSDTSGYSRSNTSSRSLVVSKLQSSDTSHLSCNTSSGSLHVTPSNLVVYLRYKAGRTHFTIRNDFKTAQEFRVMSNGVGTVKFSQEKGSLKPGESCKISVDYSQPILKPIGELCIGVVRLKGLRDLITLPVKIVHTVF